MFLLQQAPDFAPTRASTRHDHEAGRRPMLTYRTLTRSAMVLGCAGLIASCGSSPAGQNRRPGGNAVPIQTTGTKRITVQRQVDLAGTLLSPDQAKVSGEAAGVVRDVAGGDRPRSARRRRARHARTEELALALERAESALRQTRAQLGMADPLTDDERPRPTMKSASVKNALANRDDARATLERAETLSKRGLLPPAEMQTADTRLKVAEANYQAAVDNVRGLKALLQDRRASYDLAQRS